MSKGNNKFKVGERVNILGNETGFKSYTDKEAIIYLPMLNGYLLIVLIANRLIFRKEENLELICSNTDKGQNIISDWKNRLYKGEFNK